MLPVDSPKWAELECDLGGAQPIADGLRLAYEIVKEADGDPAEIRRGVEIAEGLIGNLYHQQTTYSGTAAAIPHLVHFSRLAELGTRTYIFVMIAFMDWDQAENHAPDELRQAYTAAIFEVEEKAIGILRTKKLTSEQLDNLLVAISLIQRKCLYPIRISGSGSIDCPGCETELDVDEGEQGLAIYWKDKTVPIKPTSDLATEIERERHNDLRSFYHLAVEGDHVQFLEWLKQFVGTFTCPNCDSEQQIPY